jgi:hypothetical protein
MSWWTTCKKVVPQWVRPWKFIGRRRRRNEMEVEREGPRIDSFRRSRTDRRSKWIRSSALYRLRSGPGTPAFPVAHQLGCYGKRIAVLVAFGHDAVACYRQSGLASDICSLGVVIDARAAASSTDSPSADHRLVADRILGSETAPQKLSITLC